MAQTSENLHSKTYFVHNQSQFRHSFSIPGEIIFEPFLIILIFKNFLMVSAPIIPGLKIFGFPTKLTTVDSIPIFEFTLLIIILTFF